MYLAWIIPCTLGVFVYLLLAFIPMEKVPGLVTACVYNFGVGMLTIRSIFIGVIEIYGTTNRAMVAIYTVLALCFTIVGLGLYLFIFIKEIRKKRKQSQGLTIE